MAFLVAAMIGTLLSRAHGRDCLFSVARIATFIFFMFLVTTAHATEPDMPATIRQPHEAHLQSSYDAADTVAAAATWLISRTYSTTTNPTHNAPTSRHYTTGTIFQARILKTTLWSLCISLMIVSCIVEQESSPMRIWLALSLAFSWLVPISLHLHKLIRKFQRRKRVDSFIVTTAMLSFVFIKAFAILGGYSVAALIRVPPCFTLAAWVASRWCKFDASPEIRFGA